MHSARFVRQMGLLSLFGLGGFYVKPSQSHTATKYQLTAHPLGLLRNGFEIGVAAQFHKFHIAIGLGFERRLG